MVVPGRPAPHRSSWPPRPVRSRWSRGCAAAFPEGGRALSVFGGEIAIHPDRPAAAAEVSSRGLGVLAELRWWRGEPAVLVEASPDRVVARISGNPALANVIGTGGGGGEDVALTGPHLRELTLRRPY